MAFAVSLPLQLASEFLHVDAINGNCNVLPGLAVGVVAAAAGITTEDVDGSNDSFASL